LLYRLASFIPHRISSHGHSSGWRNGCGDRSWIAERGRTPRTNATGRYCVRGFGRSGPSTLARRDWLVASEPVLTLGRSRDAFQARYDRKTRPGAHAATRPMTNPYAKLIPHPDNPHSIDSLGRNGGTLWATVAQSEGRTAAFRRRSPRRHPARNSAPRVSPRAPRAPPRPASRRRGDRLGAVHEVAATVERRSRRGRLAIRSAPKAHSMARRVRHAAFHRSRPFRAGG
jgi:hypothetical protein